MKKLFIVLFLTASFTSEAQTNVNLSTIINPAKNRGYMKWIGDDSPHYRINVYELQDTTMVLLSTQITTNNYVQFQPLLFSLPNLQYQIISLNESGTVVSEGEITNNEVPDAWEQAEILCEKVCNGRSYAWKMTAYENAPNQGGQQYIKFSSTYQYYDAEEAMFVPYWQAFTNSGYAYLQSINHPYRGTSGDYGTGSNLYQQKQINPDLPSVHLDDNNNIVANGWIIEKRLDQFQLMNGNSSISFHPPLCQSSYTAMNWANFFNDNIDLSSTGMVSPYTNYFTNVDQATCNPSGGGLGAGSGPSVPWQATLENIHNFWDCIQNVGISNSLYPCFDDFLPSGGGIIISSIEDSTKGEESVNIRFKNANVNDTLGAYYVTSHGPLTMPTIKKGLYNFTFYLPDGNALPTVIEFKDKVEEIRHLKDLASLELIPNPIINNEITFKVADKTDLQKAVRIYDIYGNLVYSENTTDETFLRTVDVSSNNSPIFIVSIIFTDGSIIQKTALK